MRQQPNQTLMQIGRRNIFYVQFGISRNRGGLALIDWSVFRQLVRWNLRFDPSLIQYPHHTVVGHFAYASVWQVPFIEYLLDLLLATPLNDNQHSFLRF